MMSSGLVVHGEHAVAFAETLIESIPTTRAKKVFTSVCWRTVTALTGLHGAVGRQAVVTVVETPGTLSRAFLPPSLPLNVRAVETALPMLGSSFAPAVAAASA